MHHRIKKNPINYLFISLILFAFTEMSWGTQEYGLEGCTPVSSPAKKRKISSELEIESTGVDSIRILGLNPQETAKVQILNAALWVNISDLENINLQQITPTKTKNYYAYGGVSPEIKENIRFLKRLYPHHVQNKEFLRSDTVITSPAARQLLTREKVKAARNLNLIYSLPPIAFVEQIEPETAEEREERKKQQLKDFLEVEKLRGKISEEQIAEILTQTGGGKSKESIAEIKKEIEIWQDHLNYINMRKKQLTVGKEELLDEDEFGDESEDDNENVLCKIEKAGSEAEVVGLGMDYLEKIKKIRKAELEDSFENFVVDKLTRLDVEGYEIYFSRETLDISREDADGVSNQDIMKLGYCPIGADGEPMNFHHLTHYDFETHKIRSIIVVITDYLHKTYSGNLHFGRNTYQDLPRKKVNRQNWNTVRPEFNKAIIKYLTQ